MYFFMLHNLTKFLEFGRLFSLNFNQFMYYSRGEIPPLGNFARKKQSCCDENGFDDVFFHIS